MGNVIDLQHLLEGRSLEQAAEYSHEMLSVALALAKCVYVAAISWHS